MNTSIPTSKIILFYIFVIRTWQEKEKKNHDVYDYNVGTTFLFFLFKAWHGKYIFQLINNKFEPKLYTVVREIFVFGNFRGKNFRVKIFSWSGGYHDIVQRVIIRC